MPNKINPKHKVVHSWLVWLISLPVRAYSYFISPLLGPRCRFHPTCSAYSLQALQQQGILRGGYLSFKRILKCHPGNAGGYDPVPESSSCDHLRGDQKALLKNCNHQHSETTT